MTLINDFMSLIYPRYCEACEGLLYKHEAVICTKCLLDLPKSNFHLNSSNPILLALGGRIPLKRANCLLLFEKEGKVQNLLHALKYQNQQIIGLKLGALFYEHTQTSDFLEGVDLIAPVPLHPKKLKQRGYNQSECFAKGITEKSHIALDTTTLVRAFETSTQTKKRKYERWENVKDVFAITNAQAFKNKHVLLVDDVITTGATLEGVWQALKDIEGIRVSVASIAYALK